MLLQRTSWPAEDAFRRVVQQGTPTMLILGRRDRRMPYRHHKRVLELIPQIEFHLVDGVGHTHTYENPKIINTRLAEFLERW